MNLRHPTIVVGLAAFAAFGGWFGCTREPEGSGGNRVGATEETEHEEGVVQKGPHGGWLFEDAGVRLELDIEEDTGPPEFVGYLSDGAGKSLPVSASTLSVVLERFGGRRQAISFRSEDDHFRSDSAIEEPHSFEVAITLEHSGRTHHWRHEQVEYRVELTPESMRAAGISVGEASARPIAVQVDAPGEVHLNGERVQQLRPRFPGIVHSLEKRLGDVVAAGDLLALIQSNESLSEYEIRAAMAGTIVSRDVAPGASVDRESVLFTIADLGTVWIDFAIYPQHIGLVRRGQTVNVHSRSGPELTATGTVSYVGPLLEQDTRVSYGRVVVQNTDGRWQAGVYVTATITVDFAQTLVAVPETAIIRSKFGPAVFRASGATFELQPIEPGRTDGTFTEVLAGLEPGSFVVTQNAFLLKAELGKSEAHHDH